MRHVHRVASAVGDRTSGAGQAPPLDALLPDGRVRRRAPDPDHRPRPRAATSTTSTATATSTGSRRSSASTPATAAAEIGEAAARQVEELDFYTHLELRPPAGDRAGGADRRARPRRPEPGLLHQRRLGGGRVGAEAGPQLPPHPRQRPEAQADRPRGRLPRHHAGGALGDRDHRAAHPVRAAGPRRLPRAEHQHLPLARGPRPALGRRRDRGADRLRGAGDGRRGDPRAGPERRRLLRPARRLLPAGARDLRRATTCC